MQSASEERYFEHYVVGQVAEHPGTIRVDGPQIVEFAEQFDPQPGGDGRTAAGGPQLPGHPAVLTQVGGSRLRRVSSISRVAAK